MNFTQQLKKFRLEKYLEISATKVTDSMPRHLQRVEGGHTKHETQTYFKYVQGCYVFNGDTYLSNQRRFVLKYW